MNTTITHTSLLSRQPATALNRLTFWGFLLTTISCGMIALMLTIFAGAPSHDILIATIVSLVATILAASRIRLLQWLNIPISAWLIYMMFTEPFVIESLVNPKGPNGGYGHFVGDVTIIAFVLMGAGANLWAVVQNYRGRSQQSPRGLGTALGVLGGMVVGALLIGAIVQPATASGTTYTNGVPTVHMGANTFTQSTITIAKGSKLLLVDDVASPHILETGSWQNTTPRPEHIAGEPAINNVQVDGNSTEIGPFPVAGTYHIYCTVHVGMNLTVIVQ